MRALLAFDLPQEREFWIIARWKGRRLGLQTRADEGSVVMSCMHDRGPGAWEILIITPWRYTLGALFGKAVQGKIDGGGGAGGVGGRGHGGGGVESLNLERYYGEGVPGRGDGGGGRVEGTG